MKAIILSFFVLVTSVCCAQKATAIISSKGAAPIPSFSLGKPAALVFFNTKLSKNLEFSPDVAFDLESGKGWFLDTWLRWNQPLDSKNIDSARWIGTVGFDWSLFFQKFSAGFEDITQSVRYPTYQAKLQFLQSKKNTFTADMWYIYAVEKEYGVKGTYVSLCYNRNEERKKVTFGGNTNTFYLSYSDGVRGLAGAYDVYLSHNKTGLFAGAQFIHSFTVEGMKPVFSMQFGITRKLQ